MIYSIRPFHSFFLCCCILANLLLLSSCQSKHTLFEQVSSSKSGVKFNNAITETDTLNILKVEYIYNGGGVGIGDLNGDGLQDLYFTGSQVENKLYLNKGNLHFEDVTAQANVQKLPGQWSSGINVLDINRDGRLDLYVCNTLVNDPAKRSNLLFINQGNDASGVPHFAEMAHAYGIDDTTHASHAQFFDYDNDGDLDLFVGVNVMDSRSPNQYIPKSVDGTAPNRDRLYRNDWDPQQGHPVFTDVSLAAGIKLAGFSHSTQIADFNEDGWPDIYVANDYVSNDLLYLNNHDGTFTNQIASVFKHQAASAMGSDAGDLNNDGRLDLFTTEMMPYYNKRKKLFLGINNYSTYINNQNYNYEYQFQHNALQLNRGTNPETGLPVFSDIAFQTGTQETEWSWAPLIADYNNDGLRDLFVTNGFPRDVTDHDFGAYRSSYNFLVAPIDLQEMIPQVKSPKFAYQNNGNLGFTDASHDWGVDVPAFSNGAAYGDLDNDGDLDLVVNNIDDEAFIFKNTATEQKNNNHYLRLNVVGPKSNPDAFGALVTAFYHDGSRQAAQIESGHGYLSASETTVHFGLGENSTIDSVIIRWGPQGESVIQQLPKDQTVTVHFEQLPLRSLHAPTSASLVNRIQPDSLGLAYTHTEPDFVDYNYQTTLPHKFSQYGPSVTVGDANGDGLDDIYISGSTRQDGHWMFQTPDGRFRQESVYYKTEVDKLEEELGALLFDADNDGDNDLYVVHGSPEHFAGNALYNDVLCVNDGAGHFSMAPTAMPADSSCGQAVKAADFDGDGDLDLFVGGRVLPLSYPMPERSFLLRNDTKEKDKPIFTDVTAQVCPELARIGLVSDALWTDYDNDNRPDLLLAGEWMPLVFFHNEGGKLVNQTAQTGIDKQTGWWTSLAAADFDNDGDIDYVAGNFGLNTYFKASEAEPLHVYAKDFDKNGSIDPFITCFWLDSLGKKREYIYHTRDDIIKQVVPIRRKFYSYGALGEATIHDVFSKEELKDALILSANNMASSYVENLGNGKFRLASLPPQAQLAPLYGMLAYDLNQDGFTDLLTVGNDYGMELLQGRADAYYGLALLNDGKGGFRPAELNESNFLVPGDARGLTRLARASGAELFLATQNLGPLKVFAPAKPTGKMIYLQPNETKASITLADGKHQLREFYRGNGFLSQESRSLAFTPAIRQIELLDAAGKVTRTLQAEHL